MRDLAFLTLADLTGWPQARLQGPEHRGERSRLDDLRASAAGSGKASGYEDGTGYTVMRIGVRAAVKLARESVASQEPGRQEYGAPRAPADAYFAPRSKLALNITIHVVAFFALATLVLAALTNLDLSIIIAPFTIPLIGLPVESFAERRARRRNAGDPPSDG